MLDAAARPAMISSMEKSRIGTASATLIAAFKLGR
jgi:hypothetical protein